MKKQNDYPWFKSYGDIKPSFDLPNVSMYEMVRRSANKYPSLIAYSYYGTKITYKSYLRKIDEAAIAFSKLGAKKGDYVSIIMPNTPEAIICFYALNKLGCIANMLHPLSGEEELKFGINLTKTKFILVSDVTLLPLRTEPAAYGGLIKNRIFLLFLNASSKPSGIFV